MKCGWTWDPHAPPPGLWRDARVRSKRGATPTENRMESLLLSGGALRLSCIFLAMSLLPSRFQNSWETAKGQE